MATVKELTRQNQEMKLQLQQEENRSKGNPEDEGDSREEVTAKDLFLRMTRIQISFER